MPRYSAASRSDVALTSVRGPSIFAGAAGGGTLREVGVFNTTTTAVAVGLHRWSANGGGGTALDNTPWDFTRAEPSCVVTNTPTANHTVTGEGSGVFFIASLGAAIGAGVIWTMGADGIVFGESTSNGVGLYLPSGTTQILDFYFVWDE